LHQPKQLLLARRRPAVEDPVRQLVQQFPDAGRVAPVLALVEGERLGPAGHDLGHRRRQDRLLAAPEVVIQRALANPDRLGDLPHRGPREPLFGEQVQCRGQYVLTSRPCLFFGWSAHTYIFIERSLNFKSIPPPTWSQRVWRNRGK